jgi:hypothetical protein
VRAGFDGGVYWYLVGVGRGGEGAASAVISEYAVRCCGSLVVGVLLGHCG